MPKLVDLIRLGDLDGIDRISNPNSSARLSSDIDIDVLLQEQECEYNPTNWLVAKRSEFFTKADGTAITLFTNNNSKCPVESLEYKTSATTNRITLKLVLRDKNAILAIMLANLYNQLQNPHLRLTTSLPVNKTMTFRDLEDDLAPYLFICDHLWPVLLLDGKQAQNASDYFRLEHQKTLRQCSAEASSPRAMLGSYMMSLQSLMRSCVCSKIKIDPAAEVEDRASNKVDPSANLNKFHYR